MPCSPSSPEAEKNSRFAISVKWISKRKLARLEKADSDVVPYFDYMSRDLQLGSSDDLAGHRELPARPTAPGQGKQYPCSIDHARDWDAADEDSIDWIVTDMPFGNCRGPKKADMARVLHATLNFRILGDLVKITVRRRYFEIALRCSS
ncbi:hypothetical protein FOZ60_000729 [Perkinsus olseni]|uniref:Uncharacterized protein n=1 Tax=Perkinsus olseni TaxID=32597 RepID=A0A7J6MXM1_PEROL|nr:hypothetical protein FOZ60_000729 [Perkinsus olseni]